MEALCRGRGHRQSHRVVGDPIRLLDCELRQSTCQGPRNLLLNLIEETGERLITALESHAARVPFPARDFHELWLLDAGGGMPLARPETAVDAARERPLATSEVFRPYPPVLGRGGLRVARVKAQLRGGAPRPEGLTEPFYAFSTE